MFLISCGSSINQTGKPKTAISKRVGKIKFKQMKKGLLASIPVFIIMFVITGTQIGCEKDSVTPVSKTDTVYNCIELSKDSVLVQKTWKVDFVYSLIGGDLAKYINGGTNTTGINFDNQRYKFNSGGTGTYTDPAGNNYDMTWEFTTSDKRTMVTAVSALGNTSTWEMVEIEGNYMQFSVTSDGADLSTYRLKQMP